MILPMTWFLYAQSTAPIDPCGILFPLSLAIRSLLIRAACLVSGANFHLLLTTHSPKGTGSMLGPKSHSFHHLFMAPHSLTSLLPSLPSRNVTIYHHHSYLAYFPGPAPPSPSSLSDQLSTAPGLATDTCAQRKTQGMPASLSTFIPTNSRQAPRLPSNAPLPLWALCDFTHYSLDLSDCHHTSHPIPLHHKGSRQPGSPMYPG